MKSRNGLISAIFFTLLLIFSLTSGLKAQWIVYNTAIFDCFTTAGNNDQYTFGGKQGIYVSYDNGIEWQPRSNGIPVGVGWTQDFVNALLTVDNTIFAGCGPIEAQSAGGIFKSTDFGENWFRSQNGFPDSFAVYSLAKSGEYIYAGTENGVLRSSNMGVSWSQCLATKGKYVKAIAANGSTIVVSAFSTLGSAPDNGIMLSTNYGSSWVLANDGLPNSKKHGIEIYCLLERNGAFYAGSDSGWVFKSINGGSSWFRSSNGIPGFYNQVHSLTTIKGCILAGCTGTGTNAGMYLSYNSGATWELFDEAMSPESQFLKHAVIKAGDYILASANNKTYRRGIWQVSIENTSSHVPSEFVLKQNYPNPFNPVTNISFQIPVSGLVTLKVYDVLGKEAALLVNENLSPGTYNYNFDASGMNSGVYFYKLTSGSYTEVKKMTLIK